MKYKLVSALLTLLSLALSAQQSSFREHLSALRREVREASKAKDYASMERLLLQMDSELHGRADTTYNLACTYALAGKKAQALSAFERFASMGAVAPDATKDPDLSSLADEPRFKSSLQRIEQNRRSVTNSRVWHTFIDPGLLTEDITYDRRSRSFFVSSMLKKKIIRIDPRGRATDFADFSRNPGMPPIALRADSARNLLWVAAAVTPDFSWAPKERWGKTALFKLDLRTGRIMQRIAPPDNELRTLADLDLAPNGDLIVSDSHGGALYRLPLGKSSFDRIDRGEFISPQGPAITHDSRFAFVADYARGIARIDLTSGELLWLKHADDIALAGTDGLALTTGRTGSYRLLAVQNGANPTRVVSLSLNSDGDTVEELQVLEANYDGLGDPTHGVLVGHDFYFLANSGWTFLDNYGNVKSGTNMTPATIRKLRLP